MTYRTTIKRVLPMKRYLVVDTSKGLWAPVEEIRALNWDSAFDWCMKHGYDIIDELD